MNEDLSFGSLGNGVTVWDKKRQKHGDSLIVAHISRERNVKFYTNDLSDEAKKAIHRFAKKSNVRMSVTQAEFVMLQPLGISVHILEKTKKEYSRIAGEQMEVKTVEYSDDIYAFGSELACLKLARHFAGEQLRLKHSHDSKWVFVVFKQLNR